LVSEQAKKAAAKPTAVVVENKETVKEEPAKVETPKVITEEAETNPSFNQVYVSMLSNKK
jgi:hypothetical protein